MQAIEFETDVTGEYIRIPEFEKLKNRHVKVIVLSEDLPEEPPISAASKQRQPARVPDATFYGDVFDTVPAEVWENA
ncbi:hypothetical protein [Hydrogenovibrio halophilus]|uniref:hypothetical protein n=1 Tax=Hydrogenovibrio halophilus TaxID=373391 RepID=UPI00036F3AFE|nr:hypothetical protein [Hydrogenovibrio halophilus]